MPDVHKIFVGGGFDDWFSHIVESYAAEYARLNPQFQCRYFSWTQGSDIRGYIRDAGDNSHVTVVGHSYGADTSFSSIHNGRPVQVLISIDPVGRFRPSWSSIRSHCRLWLNVRAEPSPARRTGDDTIAAIGGQYPRPPAPGKPDAPNYAIVADATHGAFRTMMRLTSNGASGKTLLGGASVP